MKKLQASILTIFILVFVNNLSYAQGSISEIYIRGIESGVQGKFEEAKNNFSIALKDDSLQTSAQLNLKTIDDIFKKKIEKETGIHIFKAIQYEDQGNYDLAIKEYAKAIEINPKYADSYNKRGLVYFNKNMYEQAIKDYTTAIQFNPKYTDAYNNRGIIYYNQEKYDLAILDYSKAIELDPMYAKAYHNRGLIYFTKLEDKSKGCADWKKACELGECTNYNIAKNKGLCK
jgi:tetratricopeptide (TPR) repeat protein